MDRNSTSNSSTRACTAAGSSDAMLARDIPVHPVRNLMMRPLLEETGRNTTQGQTLVKIFVQEKLLCASVRI
eukprot:scaffold266814_cov56-Attheya_sp.AAC.1